MMFNESAHYVYDTLRFFCDVNFLFFGLTIAVFALLLFMLYKIAIIQITRPSTECSGAFFNDGKRYRSGVGLCTVCYSR
jgi:hypothetical protein